MRRLVLRACALCCDPLRPGCRFSVILAHLYAGFTQEQAKEETVGPLLLRSLLSREVWTLPRCLGQRQVPRDGELQQLSQHKGLLSVGSLAQPARAAGTFSLCIRGRVASFVSASPPQSHAHRLPRCRPPAVLFSCSQAPEQLDLARDLELVSSLYTIGTARVEGDGVNLLAHTANKCAEFSTKPRRWWWWRGQSRSRARSFACATTQHAQPCRLTLAGMDAPRARRLWCRDFRSDPFCSLLSPQ